jgi:hypothetical protein
MLSAYEVDVYSLGFEVIVAAGMKMAVFKL